MLKKIFFKKIGAVLTLFIVCGFSLTIGAILLRVAFSAAFKQPTALPSADTHELGDLTAKINALEAKIGTSSDTSSANTVFGKIAGVTAGSSNNSFSLVKRVFVTSTTYKGDLKTAGNAATGLAGADNICQTQANAASLSGVWKAILSDSNTSAKQRIGYNWSNLRDMRGNLLAFNQEIYFSSQIVGDGPWTPIAWDTKGAGSSVYLYNPIKYDEFGNDLSQNTISAVWSGTGNAGNSSFNYCNYWLSNANNQRANYGNINFETIWIDAWPNILTCDNLFRLYCIEQ